ncbi:Nucleoside-diphosphate-sugar epimerase [Lentzea albidocapillata subsp. violacea]|uniref:Nucleoside-diphosphate-sugar epimerase n=1 Tax=Lentzea albidocapillata subsp. violacea TaxID=128104 RepID=A0A1G8Q3P0_9PSEU|nr:NAD-dependent epimerase/dehydratase family protein [Lentzea albidocapillata]SDI99333.1 Nucleoside-diphosphate-sugar epimerase [Lentzea albidocapillata subsp. violacea]
MPARRIVVTGASGNVGTALLRRLAEVPDVEVHGISRRPPADAPPYRGVPWTPVEIGRAGAEEVLRVAFEQADAVVHLAWLIQPSRDERLLYRTNVAGSAQVFSAAAKARVPHLVHMSSVGAYSPGSKDRRVDESWPVDGVRTSFYSRHKSAVEHMLNKFESDLLISRPRPGLILQDDAGSEIRDYFLGRLVPKAVFRHRIPVLPIPRDLVLQFVHADDVADGLARILEQRPHGGINLVADPVITPRALAELLGGRHVAVPPKLMRSLASVTWGLRLQPTPPGWVDLALKSPLLDASRARTELGWQPKFDAQEALRAILRGLGQGREVPASPVLGR